MIGVLIYEDRPDEMVRWIHWLAVVEEHRRRRIATSLKLDIMDEASGLGLTVVSLVDIDNEPMNRLNTDVLRILAEQDPKEPEDFFYVRGPDSHDPASSP